MPEGVFEIRHTDAAGRLGRLEIPRADTTIETPAFLPVINPNHQAIEPARIVEEFGAEMLITNAYVLHRSHDLRDRAHTDGVHDLLDVTCPVMTDSGSFQLAEYGEIDVDTEEILAFQDAIGSDVATPVDIPTPPDADRARASQDLITTQEAIDTAAAYDAGDMLVTGPIQGGRFSELRERAARRTYETDLDLYPIGAVVPLLRAYRFEEVVSIVLASKRGLGQDAPVHLFGAGHPMMFSLAVALGCDLFDSAAYALYAREDRYLTVRGTVALGEMTYLPCHCPVCVETSAQELVAASQDRRERLLSAHNLYVTFAELRCVKQAIVQGELLELVEARVRAHPRLLAGYRAALRRADQLELTEPASGPRPFFYLSGESADRPEVDRHHRRLARVAVPSTLLLIDPASDARLSEIAPWSDLDVIASESDRATGEETWFVIPPFGPVPPALIETYPLTAELPRRADGRASVRAAEGVAALVEATDTTVTLIHADWPDAALDKLPTNVKTRRRAVDTDGLALDPEKETQS